MEEESCSLNETFLTGTYDEINNPDLEDSIIINTEEEENFTLGNSYADPPSKKSFIIFNLAQDESYNQYQIPACHEKARLHYNCHRIGKPFNYGKSGKKKPETCPCCLKIKREPYPFTKNPTKIRNFGNTIPLYFYFYYFILAISVLLLFPSIYLMKVRFQVYCEQKKGECQLLDIFKITSSLDKHLNYDDLKWIVLISQVVVWLFYFLDNWFYKYHFERISKLKKVMKKSPSDFTVMMTNVSEDITPQKLEYFIKTELSMYNIPQVNILKMIRASYIGKVNIINSEIETINLEINSINSYISQIQAEEKNSKTKEEKVKILGKKVKSKKKELKKKNKTLEKVKRKWLKSSTLKNNMISFVTVNTIEEKNRLLKLKYGFGEIKKSKTCCSFLSSLCFSKKFAEINEAPEPDQIQWDNIGYSKCERFMNTSFTFIVSIVILTVYFAGTFFWIYLKEKTSPQGLVSKFGIQLYSLLMMGSGTITEFLTDYFIEGSKYLTKSSYQILKLHFLNFTKIVIFSISYFFYLKQENDIEKIQKLAVNFFQTKLYMEPLLSIFSFCFIYKRICQKLTIRGLKKKNPKYLMTQGELQKKFTRPELNIEKNYSKIIVIIYLCVAFSSTYPRVVPLTSILLCIKFFFDRILILRRFKPPISCSEKLYSEAMNSLKLLQLVFMISMGYHLFHLLQQFQLLLIPVFINFFILFVVLYKKGRKKIFKEVKFKELCEENNLIKVSAKSKNSRKFLRDYYRQYKKDALRREKQKRKNAEKVMIQQDYFIPGPKGNYYLPTYKELYVQFENDYDRGNPLSKKSAFENWFRCKNEKLKAIQEDDEGIEVKQWSLGDV